MWNRKQRKREETGEGISAADRERIVESSIRSSQPSVESAAEEEQDEIAPRTHPLIVKGRKLELYLSFGVLSEASRRLRMQGVANNLLFGLDFRFTGADQLAGLLFAAVLDQQPEMTYKECVELVDLLTWQKVYTALMETHQLAIVRDAETRREQEAAQSA